MPQLNFLTLNLAATVALAIVWFGNRMLDFSTDPEHAGLFVIFVGACLFFWAFAKQASRMEQLADHVRKLEKRLQAAESRSVE